jgi:P27 family predicted phage terminase small subunit
VSDKAHQAWGHVVAVLDDMGVLTRADVMALELLCEAYADYLGARDALKAFGSNYYETEGRNGTMRRAHPAVATMQDADRRIKAWLTEFGLTPSARTRVEAVLEKDADDAERYFE